MEVKTFTSFWNTEQKLYSFYDIALPVPVSLRVVGVFAVVAIPWWGLFYLLRVPFNNPSYLLWVLPPAGIAYLATKPIFQGKTIFQFLRSMISYYSGPKTLNGLRSRNYPLKARYNMTSKVFVRDEEFLRRAEKASVTLPPHQKIVRDEKILLLESERTAP